jgi:hypothetical protein
LIGLLLTATAIAKLWMLLTDSFADVRVGIPKEILWLSVAFELWLAFENFRLRDHRVMAFINTIVFAAFAIFASTRLVMGYKSCGCSGSLEIPAWVFIFADLVIICWFTICGSLRSRNGWSIRNLMILFDSKFAAGVFCAVIFCLMQSVTIRDLIRWNLGEMALSASVSDIEASADKWKAKIVVKNIIEVPVEIISTSRSCNCVEFQGEIGAIPPGGERIFQVSINRNYETSRSSLQRVLLFLDAKGQRQLPVDCYVEWRKK